MEIAVKSGNHSPTAIETDLLKKEVGNESFFDLERVKTPDTARRRRMQQAQHNDFSEASAGRIHYDDPSEPVEAIPEITNIELFHQQVGFQNVNNFMESVNDAVEMPNHEHETTAVVTGNELPVFDMVDSPGIIRSRKEGCESSKK